MGKSKRKKKIDLQKIKEKIKEKKYHLLLILLCVFLFLIYIQLFKTYRIYTVHHYHYYSSTVFRIENLKEGNFADAYYSYLDSLKNKLIFLRNLPLIFFNKITQIKYVSMAILTNLVLLYLLFLSLEKIFKTEYVFYFIVFIIFSYFFLEILISPYADLHSFFATALFYLAVYKYVKMKKKNYVELTLTVLLMFLARSTSYLHFPIIFGVLILYMLLSKVNPKKIDLFMWCCLIGFLLFVGVAFGFSFRRLAGEASFIDHLEKDFGYTELKNMDTNSTFLPGNFLKLSTFFIEKYSHFDLRFTNKFPFSFLNYLLYVVVFYNLLKKKKSFFIMLFFANELYNIILFNFLNMHINYRFYLPGYFIYLYLIFDFIVEWIKKILKKLVTLNLKWNTVVLFILVVSVVFYAPHIKRNYEKVALYNIYFNSRNTEIFHNQIFPQLEQNSTIYMENVLNNVMLYGGQVFSESEGVHYYDYSKHDPRFSYRIVYDLSEADYLICYDCDYEYELLNTYSLYVNTDYRWYDIKVYRI